MKAHQPLIFTRLTTESTFSKKRENLRRKESEDSKDSDKSGQLGTEVVGAAAALLLKLN